jgi:hypothetical protein
LQLPKTIIPVTMMAERPNILCKFFMYNYLAWLS